MADEIYLLLYWACWGVAVISLIGAVVCACMMGYWFTRGVLHAGADWDMGFSFRTLVVLFNLTTILWIAGFFGQWVAEYSNRTVPFSFRHGVLLLIATATTLLIAGLFTRFRDVQISFNEKLIRSTGSGYAYKILTALFLSSWIALPICVLWPQVLTGSGVFQLGTALFLTLFMALAVINNDWINSRMRVKADDRRRNDVHNLDTDRDLDRASSR
ncbi:MAG: hypothetical protein AAF402_07195 [Pseudomonadota bacterium]